MGLPSPGLQCIVLGKRYDVCSPEVLDCVKAAGYASIEAGAKDPQLLRRLLDERGLAYAGCHVTPPALADLKPIVDRLRVLGGADVCSSGLMVWDQRSAADYRRTISVLNEAGRQLRREDIRLHYHNHDFEFHKVDGEKTGMDLLLEGLDFDAVDLCADVAWVAIGGCKPDEFLLRHRERIGYVHLKDHDGTDWTELGRGRVDLAGVMAVLPRLAGVRHVMVEQDRTRIDPLQSIAISREYLRATFNY